MLQWNGLLRAFVVGMLVMAPFEVVAQASRQPAADAGASVVSDGDPLLKSLSGNPDYGITDYTIFNVSAAAFTPMGSEYTWGYFANGYIYLAGGGGSNSQPSVWMPVVLPAGVILNGFRFFYYDDDASENIRIDFKRFYGDGFTEGMQYWISSGAPGYDSVWVTVNKQISYMDASSNEQCFVLKVTMSITDTLMFKGVRLMYHRQVSPAPATATFNDVPTGHWAFRFVEALAASGITAGCGGGNYCPDQPITRGEMAVYLAAALGLHWTGTEPL